MVTQEMMSTGQAAALYVGQLLKNIAAVVVFCAATWLWSWQLGALMTVAVPVLLALLRGRAGVRGQRGRLGGRR